MSCWHSVSDQRDCFVIYYTCSDFLIEIFAPLETIAVVIAILALIRFFSDKLISSDRITILVICYTVSALRKLFRLSNIIDDY